MACVLFGASFWYQKKESMTWHTINTGNLIKKLGKFLVQYTGLDYRYVRKYFFSERVVDRWNKLNQGDVDCGSINGFKNRLEGIRKTRIGFFMEFWTSSAKPRLMASSDQEYFDPGVATPGKWPTGALSLSVAGCTGISTGLLSWFLVCLSDF